MIRSLKIFNLAIKSIAITMNSKRFIFHAIFFTGLLILSACNTPQTPAEKPAGEFSFVFMTDIHVQPEKNGVEGFRAAIGKVNELSPDFVITGGDLVMDVLATSYGRADTLYNIYTGMLREFNMPVFNTVGNHEIYGWYESSGASPLHPEYGKAMFEKRISPRFQRVDRFGLIFFILDSVEKDEKGGYRGGIDAEQMEWLKEQLSQIDPATPVAISTHIPLLTVAAQVYEGPTVPNAPGIVVTNAKEVIGLFKDHNLKLVMQGHLHYYEDIYLFGTRYITAGAVSGAWWEGPYFNTEEGFLLVRVSDDRFTYEYIDYGWEAID